MRKRAVAAFGLSAALFMAFAANAQPPGGEKGRPGQPGQPGPGKGGFPGQPGGPGGFGGRTAPGTVMPEFVAQQLKLSDDQKKQMADLQKDVDAKLEKILNEEQRTQLKQMKERGPGGRGPGGFPGRPEVPGGNPPPKKDPNDK